MREAAQEGPEVPEGWEDERMSEQIEKARRVRTAAGSVFFGLPIGSIITGSAMARARKKHGFRAVNDAMDSEMGISGNRNHLLLHGNRVPSQKTPGTVHKVEISKVEAEILLAKSITPGGRVGDNSPLAKPGSDPDGRPFQ